MRKSREKKGPPAAPNGLSHYPSECIRHSRPSQLNTGIRDQFDQIPTRVLLSRLKSGLIAYEVTQ